ncbi:Ref family recombination enhancement nuclease [Pantoea sp. GD03673]|uniref:Ref family recombination enhancement nuclease n=1 Tax=Pantoea sp. GD03673 TaxID=2975364 RepID=UPI00244A5E3C|nr:Ref family recombination enhancement nuclease [Pantoea sp. GD03673]MDH2069487.1 Ref family protein [Pantoea sp. GD03673]
MADPEYRQQQYAKQKATSSRMIARQIEKRNTPEWIAEQRAKAVKRAVSVSERLKEKKAAPVTPKRQTRTSASGRGLKGRTPTAAERVVMDALGKLPCIACLQHGKESPLISLHHIEGRTKTGAHFLQLPLCDPHHQHAAPATIRADFPWLVPVHADGIVGGKVEFVRYNGTEKQLMVKAYNLAGIIHLLP